MGALLGLAGVGLVDPICRVLRIQGSGFRVQGVRGLGFRAQNPKPQTLNPGGLRTLCVSGCFSM